MLPSPLRLDLRQNPDIFSQARVFRSRFWTGLWRPAPSSSQVSPALNQWAIIVKKNVARGVQRSQLKRQVRQAIVALPPSLPQTDLQIVLIPRRSVLNTPHALLVEDLQNNLKSLYNSRI